MLFTSIGTGNQEVLGSIPNWILGFFPRIVSLSPSLAINNCLTAVKNYLSLIIASPGYRRIRGLRSGPVRDFGSCNRHCLAGERDTVGMGWDL